MFVYGFQLSIHHPCIYIPYPIQVSHQTETIAQLNREIRQWEEQTTTWQEQSQHWQTQCRHLTETSRREVQDWKEQYLQAEKERVRLMDRLDDLIKSQEGVSPHQMAI
ncbi:hypothetical protein OE88DRAFT_1657709 [Heliocybe sulcata]|uniref:Uncharacterized protein n=1 Tax=Heliocybe sulcata TaxID=5364 RepID=A0A5C3N5J3_9AGAM|nr:hypothetical protein OE88DRAFT_1657709 [Heliocybe sulcata]